MKWPEDYLDKIVQGNNIDVMRNMPEESVHCVVTSPPYWGLRDYGTPPQIWGGDPECKHKWGAQIQRKGGSGNQGKTSQRAGRKNTKDQKKVRYSGAHCACGAWRGNLGLEPTPGLFIDNIVRVFREVWRVLRKDGTLWLNMGDTYFTSGGHADKDCADRRGEYRIGTRPMSEYRMHRKTKDMGAGMRLKNKDLILMPARVAIALQEDGWYVRNDIIWAKKNCMPESVKDRCTVAHEDIFLLAKSEKYFYDAEAIKEPVEASSIARVSNNDGNPKWNTDRQRGFPGSAQTLDINKMVPESGMRNKRTVWWVATQPYPEAHFATFPPKLITPCILAGTSEKGACSKCGTPILRLTETDYTNPGNRSTNGPRSKERKRIEFGTAGYEKRLEKKTKTIGWKSICDCKAETRPCIVMDPFGGAGTIALVAAQYDRRSVSIELNSEYCEMGRKRVAGEQSQRKFL